MNLDKVRAVLRQYAERLSGLGYEPVRADAKATVGAPPDGVMRRHALWMCDEVLRQTGPNALDPFSEGKAKRWLGFVQGILWATSVRTIEELKDDNRPAGTEAS